MKVRGPLLGCGLLCILLLAGFVFLWCSPAQFGLPRVALQVASPDGTVMALVRNHMEIDPPSQSLWLQPEDGKKVMLRKLAADSDWCNLVVWSADGSTVVFLVQDARLIVADAASLEVSSERWLIDYKGAYPPREKVIELQLSSDGSEATYRRCLRRSLRRSGLCSEREGMGLREVEPSHAGPEIG